MNGHSRKRSSSRKTPVQNEKETQEITPVCPLRASPAAPLLHSVHFCTHCRPAPFHPSPSLRVSLLGQREGALAALLVGRGPRAGAGECQQRRRGMTPYEGNNGVRTNEYLTRSQRIRGVWRLREKPQDFCNFASALPNKIMHKENYAMTHRHITRSLFSSV